jgi:hypothetical protein
VVKKKEGKGKFKVGVQTTCWSPRGYYTPERPSIVKRKDKPAEEAYEEK